MEPGDLCRAASGSRPGAGANGASGGRRATGRRLSVIVTDERGRPARAGGLAGWLRKVAPVRARGVVGIAIVSDGRVRSLNRKYLGHDCATDVLSFPVSALPNRPPASSVPYLGDIVIARGVARRQARAIGHAEPTELRVLALHGLLHLLGYDHERDRGTMARLERRLRRKGGLPAGLLDRTAFPRASEE